MQMSEMVVGKLYAVSTNARAAEIVNSGNACALSNHIYPFLYLGKVKQVEEIEDSCGRVRERTFTYTRGILFNFDGNIDESVKHGERNRLETQEKYQWSEESIMAFVEGLFEKYRAESVKMSVSEMPEDVPAADVVYHVMSKVTEGPIRPEVYDTSGAYVISLWEPERQVALVNSFKLEAVKVASSLNKTPKEEERVAQSRAHKLSFLYDVVQSSHFEYFLKKVYSAVEELVASYTERNNPDIFFCPEFQEDGVAKPGNIRPDLREFLFGSVLDHALNRFERAYVSPESINDVQKYTGWSTETGHSHFENGFHYSSVHLALMNHNGNGHYSRNEFNVRALMRFSTDQFEVTRENWLEFLSMFFVAYNKFEDAYGVFINSISPLRDVLCPFQTARHVVLSGPHLYTSKFTKLIEVAAKKEGFLSRIKIGSTFLRIFLLLRLRDDSAFYDANRGKFSFKALHVLEMLGSYSEETLGYSEETLGSEKGTGPCSLVTKKKLPYLLSSFPFDYHKSYGRYDSPGNGEATVKAIYEILK